MVAGSIIIMDDQLREKLDGLEWNRKDGDFQLKSLIQYNENTLSAAGKTVETAIVIHEHIVSHYRLSKRKDGSYSLVPKKEVDTSWANIFIMPSYIVVDKKDNRHFVREIIASGLKLPPYTPAFLALDTKKIAADNKNHWVRAFAERKGRANEGVVYGDAVEQDAEIGPALAKAKVRSVGITTKFFGNPVKTRVSSNGVISVLGSHTYEQFIEYYESEIKSYRIETPL